MDGDGSLGVYENAIDQIDNKFAELLKQREWLSTQIGRVKAESGLPVEEFDREVETVRRLHERTGLSEENLASAYEPIFERSKEIQEKQRV